MTTPVQLTFDGLPVTTQRVKIAGGKDSHRGAPLALGETDVVAIVRGVIGDVDHAVDDHGYVDRIHRLDAETVTVLPEELRETVDELAELVRSRRLSSEPRLWDDESVDRLEALLDRVRTWARTMVDVP